MIEILPSASMKTHDTELQNFFQWDMMLEGNQKFWERIQTYNMANIKRFTQLHFYSNLISSVFPPRRGTLLFNYLCPQFLTAHSGKYPKFGAYFPN